MNKSEILALKPGKELDKLVAVHVMELKEGVDFGTFSEHEWMKDEYGDVDDSAWTSGYCSGPVCVRCGHTYCIHCNNDEDKHTLCKEEVLGYSCNLFSIDKILKKIGDMGFYFMKFGKENPFDNDSKYVWILNKYNPMPSKIDTFPAVEISMVFSADTLQELICKFALLKVLNLLEE